MPHAAIYTIINIQNDVVFQQLMGSPCKPGMNLAKSLFEMDAVAFLVSIILGLHDGPNPYITAIHSHVESKCSAAIRLRSHRRC